MINANQIDLQPLPSNLPTNPNDPPQPPAYFPTNQNDFPPQPPPPPPSKLPAFQVVNGGILS